MRRKRFEPFYVGIVASVLHVGAAAQTPPEPAGILPQVTVTAPEVDNPSLTVDSLDAARERVERAPGGVAVIDAESYRGGRAAYLDDSLGWTAGVYAKPRFGAEETRLSIRGSGIQRTFHLRGIKLLQDGVPLNLADGGGDFQSIDPLAVRYIEVYRGANALEHGSTTLGGAINFVTPSGHDAPPLGARLELGSFDYARAQVHMGAVHDTLDHYLSYTHASQDGFREHARQNNNRLFFNVGARVHEDLETRFYLALIDSKSELPGNLTKAELQSDPTLAAPDNVARDYRRDYTQARISNKTTLRVPDGRVELGAFYSWKDLFHPIFQVLDIVSVDYGVSLRYVSQASWLGRKNIFTVGFVPVRGVAEDDRFLNVGGNRGTRSGDSTQTSKNYDLYAENQHYIQPRLALVTGAQWSRARRELDDHHLADGADNSVDKTYRGFSPKLGARYELTPNAQLFANLSRSFEPPSFGELAGGPNVTPVKEQTAKTFEIGTRGVSGEWRWDAVYYYAEVKDELLSLIDPLGNPLGTTNASDTVHQGLELAAEIPLARALSLRQAYLLNDFRFKDDPAFGNNMLAGIPKYFYRAELTYRTAGGLYLGPNVEWSPRSYPVDHANTVSADRYAIWGFKLGQRPRRGAAWFVEGRNLGDRKYAAATGTIATANGMDVRQFLPGDGRSFYAGVEWRN